MSKFLVSMIVVLHTEIEAESADQADYLSRGIPLEEFELGSVNEVSIVEVSE